MAVKEYKLTISNEIIGLEAVDAGPTETETPTETAKKLKKKATLEEIGKTIAIQMGTKALTFATSNYGNLTGDYIMQDNIQGIIQGVGLIGMIASGPSGAILAGSGLAIQAVGQSLERSKRKTEVEMLRLRTGMMYFSGGR